ncbi:MAG: alpha/beta hydrolase [Micropepsaceae bacterium]
MTPDALNIRSHDGVPLAVWRWNATRPRAIVQIAHGMGEHALRYARLAAALTAASYAVFANDHRGHGATSPDAESLGDFGPGGFDAVVGDLGMLAAVAREEHPGLPLILLGHSMGSFAAQYYVLQRSHDIEGLVLSGSSALDMLAASLADPEAVKLDNAFNAPFEPSRTPFDWLSRDNAEVDAYIADPLCGFTVRPEGLATIFAGAAGAAAPTGVRSGLPILLLAGEDDPLNGKLALLDLLAQRYRDAGVADVQTQFYPGGRHEMFNETNRAEVTANLIDWLNRVTA